MILRLNELEVDCIIGERADERDRLQRLLLDVELEIPSTAAQSDELADTVDYAALAEKIRAALVAAECRMIECAAKTAFDAAGRYARRVSVRKYGTVPGLRSAEVIYDGG